MPLTPGTRLGPYEVLSKLGEGGMGEVYRARDSKLNRDVAIKVLPERLAEDPAALARFEREAQAVAALSHPNILAIHDFGTATGVTYAVTELLEGDTLRARLADGALPTRKAVDYGVHIVLGIAAAHGRGIVHRDLKPENIFITRDGVVKILDFGLAKADGDGRDDQTKIADTTPGTVMGTVGYMSPEQVRAQPIDHRTDIFSFGAIFYEMLTGRRAFRGDSQVETMNAILKEDPPEFAEVNPNLPGSLDRIIRRCLEKQPSDRFHSAHDLGIALEALSGSTNQSASTIAARATESIDTPVRKGGISPLLAAAAIAIVGAAAFFAGRALSGSAAPAPPEFKRLTYRRGLINSAHMTPDGQTFVYSAAFDAPVRSVYTTRADSPESAELPYPDPIVTAVSPKGELALIMKRRSITGYSIVGTLARASLSGGATRDLLEDVQDADWLPDGSDLVVAHAPENRYRLEWPIGKAVYQTDGWISHVRVSPDGRHVAFLDHPSMGDDRGNAAVIDASGKKQILGGDCDSTQGLAWTPSGNEVWFTCAHGGSASRQLLGVTLAGAIRTILRVPGSLTLGDIAADGSALVINNTDRRGMIALAPGETQERDLSWLDWTQPMALSDDGKTVLITEEAEGGGVGYTVYLRKTDGSPAIKLGPGEAVALSPDGKWVIAQKIDGDPPQFLLLPTGAGQARALTSDNLAHTLAAFHPDGKRFLFSGYEAGKPPRIWIQDLAGGKARALTPEGISNALMSGPNLVVRKADGLRVIVPLDGGPEQPIKVLTPTDAVVRFTNDGRAAYLRVRTTTPGVIQVVKVDLTSGARTTLHTITAIRESLPSGGVGQLRLSEDGKSYVYGYGSTQSELFLIKGVK